MSRAQWKIVKYHISLQSVVLRGLVEGVNASRMHTLSSHFTVMEWMFLMCCQRMHSPENMATGYLIVAQWGWMTVERTFRYFKVRWRCWSDAIPTLTPKCCCMLHFTWVMLWYCEMVKMILPPGLDFLLDCISATHHSFSVLVKILFVITKFYACVSRKL